MQSRFSCCFQLGIHSERDRESQSLSSEPQNAVGRHRSLEMSINRQSTKILTEIQSVDKNTAQDIMVTDRQTSAKSLKSLCMQRMCCHAEARQQYIFY